MHRINNQRPMGDLDLFVTTALWFELSEKFTRTRTQRVSEETLRETEGEWYLITPPRHDPKRRCDPAILRGYIEGLTVDVFCDWRRRGGSGDFDVNFYMMNAELVQGWPCAPLQLIMDWKLGQGRNKDLTDVIAIREHLGIEGVIAD
jgi:hypothetical protein